MKTLKITEITHYNLTKLKVYKKNKSYNETINWLIEYFYYTPLKHEKHYNFNDGEHDGNK